MINTKYPLLFPIIISVIASIARIWNLSILNSDNYSQLLTSNLILIFLFLLISIFLYKSSLTYRKIETSTFHDAFLINNTICKVLQNLSAILIIAVGGFSLYFSTLYNSMIPETFLSILTILVGISLLYITKIQISGVISKSSSFILTIPMFWACFDLTIIFKTNGSNPIIFHYAYDLFTIIAIMYTFYALISFVFAKGKPWAFILLSTVSISLIIFTIISKFAYSIIFGQYMQTYDIIRYVSYSACGLFFIGNTISIMKNLFITKTDDPFDGKLL